MLNQQPAAAIEAYQKEYALSPGDADLAYTIGRLYARTGQKTEAMEWLRRAFESGFKKELVLKYDREWDAFRESDAWKALWKK
jgi:tetratricopeptide (TPR) repeat protein